MIYGFMPTGHDCCGLLVGDTFDVSELDKALAAFERFYWGDGFVVFYTKAGKFTSVCLDQLELFGSYERKPDWPEFRAKILERLEALKGE